MQRYLLMTLLACLASAEAMAQNREPAFVPAQGWILVDETPEAVQADIASYAAIWFVVHRPDSFRVELHPQSGGRIALLFPDGFPALDLAGLAAWLGSPCRKQTPPIAAAWIAVPDGDAYYFESDPTLHDVEDGEDQRDRCDEDGGLLVGASRAGQSVRSDVPRTHLVRSDAGPPYRPEPALRRSVDAITVHVTLDTGTPDRSDALVLDTRSGPELVDEAIGYCRDLNVVDENAAGGELWFWLQSHRVDVSRELWHEAGRAAIAAAKTTATMGVDKACLRRLEREAEILDIVRE